LIPLDLNRELCLCGIPYIDGPVVKARVRDVGHDPGQTTVAGFISNADLVDVSGCLPGDPVCIPDGHYLSAVGRGNRDPPGGGIQITGIGG
jgi:hypothetical protein